MRVFAISDLHLDYKENREWFYNISRSDFTEDILIIAGDINHRVPSIVEAFKYIEKCFRYVCFVPGNHDLWVLTGNVKNSLTRFDILLKLARDYNIKISPLKIGKLKIVPLYSWYDFTFGKPADELMKIWRDFTACKWPEGMKEQEITDYFLSLNRDISPQKGETIISFSHFLPRIDIMPCYIPPSRRNIYPALGTTKLEPFITSSGSTIHVYGHSHVNNETVIGKVKYVNNAFGYPSEKRITRKELLRIYDY